MPRTRVGPPGLVEGDDLEEPLMVEPEAAPPSKQELDGGALVVLTGDDGLTSAQAATLLAEWGPNALPENKKSKVRGHDVLLPGWTWDPLTVRWRDDGHRAHNCNGA